MDGMLVTPNLFIVFAKCWLGVVSVHRIVNRTEFEDIGCVVKWVGVVWFDDEWIQMQEHELSVFHDVSNVGVSDVCEYSANLQVW